MSLDGRGGLLGIVVCSMLALWVTGCGSSAGSLKWSAPVSAGPAAPGWVWCATSRFCAGGGDTSAGDQVSIFDGKRWGEPTPIISVPGNSGQVEVSCPTVRFCALVDVKGYGFTWDGRSWSPPVNVFRYPAPAGSYGSSNVISCPTAEFCVVAGDLNGDAVFYQDGRWRQGPSIRGRFDPPAVDSLSCPTTTFCALADNFGRVVTWNGETWSKPANIDAGEAKGTAVSCPPTTFCVYVDSDGNASTYNGTKWGSSIRIDHSTIRAPVTNPPGPAIAPAGPLAVSCPTTRLCVAVDLAGNALTYNGVTWSKPTRIDPGQELSAVSCPSTRFCLATDGTNYLVYH